MTKGYINITDRKKRCVILKRMKHALKAFKDNERWVREIALLRKEYEENKDENIDIQRFTAKER